MSDLWRCLGSLMIAMGKKLFNEISKERKIKEMLFNYFKIKLPKPSKQWTFFSIGYKVILPK